MWTPARFTDALERDYQSELAPRKVLLTRVTMLLAIGLVLAYAILDLWVVESALYDVWMLRGVMCVGSLACLAWSWHPAFPKYYPIAAMASFGLLGAGILVMIYVVSPTDIAYHNYFMGLILIATALHALTLLNVQATTVLSATFFLVYVLIAVYEQNYLATGNEATLVTNLFCFVSVVLISIIAQVVREQYARENYVLRHSLARDVEFKDEARRRAIWIAENDLLTSIGNRLYFEREAARLLVSATNQRRYAIVMFIDLNDFKAINDNHGHAVGDRALKFVAEQLYLCLQPDDVLARNGGDEFVACLARDEHESVSMVVTRMISQLGAGLRIRGTVIPIGASIGVACAPLDGTSLVDVLAVADREMYRIKSLGISGFSLSEGIREHVLLHKETAPPVRRLG